MMYILLLDHWTDMTFHLKDVGFLIVVLSQAIWLYQTTKSNKKEIGELKKNTEIKARIAALEKKNDDFKDDFSELKIQLAKLRFEIVKDVIYEVRKIFGNKK